MASRIRHFLLILLAVATAFMVPSCADSGKPGQGEPTGGSSEKPGGARIAEGLDTADSPTITRFVLKQNPDNHLSYWIDLDTDRETTARVLAEGDDGSNLEAEDGAPTAEHSISLLGLVSDTGYTLQAVVTDRQGKETKSGLVFLQTDPLPEDFPPIEVTVLNPDRIQPGVTVFNIYRYIPERDHHFGLLIGVNELGKVVWYHRDTLMTMNTSLTRAGNLLFNRLVLGSEEIDWMGRVIHRWNMTDLRVWFIHHEIMELPWGNLMVLSSEKQTVDGYGIEGVGEMSFDVIGDVVVEFDRAGTRVHRWSMFDYLDPHRVKAGFFDQTFWRKPYFWVEHPMDWTHANAVLYDEKDHSFIVSLRNQDWLVKIDMESDRLVWRFGEEGDFVMKGAGQWPYHQHAPRFMENGNIILYDNGNNRPLPKDQAPVTRVVEYRLDETAMTAKQIWEYAGDEPYFAPYLGDVAPLDNGNILICDGGLTEDPYQHVDDPDNRKFARLVEVTYGADPEKVWEMTIDDPGIGYSIYSVIRVVE